MKKIIMKLAVLMLTFFFSCENTTKEPVDDPIVIENEFVIVKESIKINIDKIKDFTGDDNNFYFLTDKEIIKTDRKGNIKARENQNNVIGIFLETDGIISKFLSNYSIVKNNRDTSKIRLDSISKAINTEDYPLYLAKDSSNYYSCQFVHFIGNIDKISFSCKVIFWDSSLFAKRYIYFPNMPSGIHFDSEYFYFLTNGRNPNDTNYSEQYGRLFKYVAKTALMEKLMEFPFHSPLGFFIGKDGNYYTYSQHLKEVVVMKEK